MLINTTLVLESTISIAKVGTKSGGTSSREYSFLYMNSSRRHNGIAFDNLKHEQAAIFTEKKETKFLEESREERIRKGTRGKGTRGKVL